MTASYVSHVMGVSMRPPVDICYQEDFPRAEGARVFSVEFLPGQFDQRADSAMQCLQLLNEKEEPIIRSATTYVFSGNISDEELIAILIYMNQALVGIHHLQIQA